MADRPQQIFLSYQRDDAAFAEEVRGWLLDRGLQPWMDVHDIPAGAYWPDAIDAALQGAEIVIGVLSPASVASRNVKNEWDWALGNNRQLILLLIEPCDIPHRYISLNHFDFTGHDRGPAYRQLASAIDPSSADTTTPDGDGAAGSTPAAPQMPAPAGSRLRRALNRRAAAPVLVGRDHEQARLSRVLDDAIDGRGSLVLIGGEAGVGKTTLVSWLRHQASERSVLALTGGCYDLTTTPPYGPWGEILRAYQPGDGLPVVPEQVRTPEGFDSIPSQAALFEIVGEFFAEVSEDQPLLLVLEDLHWSDAGSLDFLRFFARFLEGLPVLVIATYRDDELTRRHRLFELLPLLVRESNADQIALDRFDADRIRALVTSRYDLPSEDAERLTDHLDAMADGNPLFVTELLKSLEDQQVLRREGEQWQLGELRATSVPPLLRNVIESRLARLAERTEAALQVAAVIGHEVPLRLWQEIAGLSDTEFDAFVEEAQQAQILEEVAGPTTVIFHHALVREVLYESLIITRRQTLHRSVADSLIETGTADPDRIAHHLVEAADPRSAEWLIRAGDRALQSFSWLAARDRYQSALSSVGSDNLPPDERGWILLKLGYALRHNHPREALVYLNEATDLAATSEDRGLGATAAWIQAFVRSSLGENALAEHIGAFEELERLNDSEYRRIQSSWFRSIDHIQMMHAHWLANYGQYDAAIRTTNNPHRRLGDVKLSDSPALPAPWGNAPAARSIALGALGQPEAALREVDRAIRTFRQNRDNLNAFGMSHSRLDEIVMAYFPDQPEIRRSASYELVENTNFVRAEVYENFPGVHSFYELVVGAWDDAYESSLAFLEQSNVVIIFPIIQSLYVLGTIDRYRGHRELAKERLSQAIPDGPTAQPSNVVYRRMLLLQRLGANLALDEEDLATAATWIESNQQWMDWSGIVQGRGDLELLRARFQLIAGDFERAREHADAALKYASDPRQPLALLAAHRFLGKLDTLEIRHTLAREHLQTSLDVADACEAPFERALTLLEIARLNVATEHIDVARRQLNEVRKICEPLGAKPTLVRVAELEAELAVIDG